MPYTAIVFNYFSNSFFIPKLNKFDASSLTAKLIYELKINWLFIKSDVPVLVLPGLLFTITALLNNPQVSAIQVLWSIVSNFIYVWLCLTSFCIANQINSIHEDRLNKPDRPLVQGIVSDQGAQIRWYLAMVLLPFLGWYFGIFWWAIFWEVAVITYNQFNFAKHWATKNLMSAYGVISVIAASWQMVGAISPIVWSWLAVLGCAILVLIPLSDLRDLEGDIAIGRSTFPLVFGEIPSRIFLSFSFGVLPIFIHVFLMAPMGNSLMVIFWDILLAISSLIIAVRVFCCRSQADDHQTYMMFTYWYCLVLLSSNFILRI